MEWEGTKVTFPDELKNIPLEMGIDEAGRGPAVGPMIYTGAVAPLGYKWPDEINDSKQLTAEKREELFEMMKSLPIGFSTRVLSAEEISAQQTALVEPAISLNTISHRAARDIVKSFLNAGLKVQALFVDTVGKSDTYQDWLKSQFPDIDITVSSKADGKFKVVGAASICAKVTRDKLLDEFEFVEPGITATKDYGSGYPSDPKLVSWLKDNFDNVFGYPSIARFDWKPVKSMFEEKHCEADFESPEEHIPDSPFFATRHLKQFCHKQ